MFKYTYKLLLTCFMISLALFWCGRKRYKIVPPDGNVVMMVSCAVGVSHPFPFDPVGYPVKIKFDWLIDYHYALLMTYYFGIFPFILGLRRETSSVEEEPIMMTQTLITSMNVTRTSTRSLLATMIHSPLKSSKTWREELLCRRPW